MTLDLEELRRRLAERPRQTLPAGTLREAAVLVPILAPAPERLVLTVRHAALPTHAGQISFPGGKRETSDVDAAAAAIREAHEELAISSADVDVLGFLDDVPTPSGFLITPVIAHIADRAVLTAHPGEVAEVLTPTLWELARPELHTESGERRFMGHTYRMHEYQWNDHRIWGATARMIYQLLELI